MTLIRDFPDINAGLTEPLDFGLLEMRKLLVGLLQILILAQSASALQTGEISWTQSLKYCPQQQTDFTGTSWGFSHLQNVLATKTHISSLWITSSRQLQELAARLALCYRYPFHVFDALLLKISLSLMCLTPLWHISSAHPCMFCSVFFSPFFSF